MREQQSALTPFDTEKEWFSLAALFQRCDPSVESPIALLSLSLSVQVAIGVGRRKWFLEKQIYTCLAGGHLHFHEFLPDRASCVQPMTIGCLHIEGRTFWGCSCCALSVCEVCFLLCL
jgi:hypothetical protein